MTNESSAEFSAALTDRLSGHSGRALAKKANWGPTVVNDIKAGRKLPTPDQLDDLLEAKGVEEAERTVWQKRLSAVHVGTPRSPAITPEESHGVKQSPPRGSRRSILLIASTVTVVVAVLAALLIYQQSTRASTTQSMGTPSISPTTKLSASTPSSKGGNTEGTIASPDNGSTAGVKKGVVLHGHLDDGGTSSYWLVDQDSDGTYTADTPVNRSGGGNWFASDRPLGDATDIPAEIAILLIGADDDCAAVLRREVDAADSTFERLPKGCSIRDKISVTVNRP